MGASASQKQGVVRELGMVNVPSVVYNSKPWQSVDILALIELKAEDWGLDSIKKGRQRESLSEASGGFEKVRRSAIDKGGYPRESTQVLIQFIMLGEKPNFAITENRKSCLTLSKALAKSSLMTIPFSLR